MATTTIDVRDLRRRIAAGDTVIVDARPMRCFNGWREPGQARGGHIPGAVAFPVEWLDRVEPPEVERQLIEKGIPDAHRVVVYATEQGAAGRLASHLRTTTDAEITVLEPGFGAWAADSSLPIARLARYEELVHVDWLRRVIAGESPDAAPRSPIRLCHVNFGGPEEYEAGHIPGAIHLDTDLLEDPADWDRRSPSELDEALRSLGITVATPVVLYGRDTEGEANELWPGRRAGQIAAARALAILRYAGVEDVRLLDGGYDAWVRGGGTIETVSHHPIPVPTFGAPIPRRPEVMIDRDEVKRILADPDGAVLVSVRSWREHTGATSGYGFFEPAGRIRGDVWGNCGSDASHMQHYRTIDNTMRAFTEIERAWGAAGITPDKQVAFYCGTGWRASEAWLYARLLGWERIGVYDGGWYEWSRNPDENPIDTGEPGASATG